MFAYHKIVMFVGVARKCRCVTDHCSMKQSLFTDTMQSTYHAPHAHKATAGLTDLNHVDLNHWFKLWNKLIDFFIKVSDLN